MRRSAVFPASPRSGNTIDSGNPKIIYMPPSVPLFDVEPILDTLHSGSLVITSNQRLATRISNAYVMACAQRGRAVVETPRVYSLGGWIERQWLQLLGSAFPAALQNRLLDSHQEQYLWETLVANTAVGQALLRPQATAQQAMNAYRLMIDWQLDRDHPAVLSHLQSSEDSRIWLDWAGQFDSHCREHACMPAVRLPELLIDGYRQGFLQPQGDIALLGFLDMPPLHDALLASAGDPQHCVLPRQPGNVCRVQCDSDDQEILAAAAWAKQLLKNDYTVRVALVVPDLNQRRARVERLLLEVFEPGYNVVDLATAGNDTALGMERRALPFNISAGYPLLDAPVVNVALELLSLLGHEVELACVEGVLQSPFVSTSAVDIDCAAQLIERCRRQRSFTVNAALLRQWAADIAGGTAGEEPPWGFANALQQAASRLRQQQRETAPGHADWCRRFEDLLALFGWPGRRSPDSIEYQQLLQWREVLMQFSSLGAVAPEQPLSFGEALAQLRALTAKQVFQPQTADSPLQVLGTLEAAGLQFTHLWLTSMSTRTWPPPPAPNPLLPVSLQAQHGMPHSDVVRALDYAEKLSQQLLSAADNVVVSAPAVIDEQPVECSRLFHAWPQRTLGEVLGRELQTLLPLREIRRRYLESRQLEAFAAGGAPALDGEGVNRGGVAIFSDQSDCPFRAFARHRLRIAPLDQPQLGLSAADRGSILHRALELFWNSVESLEGLRKLDDEALRERCRQSSQYAVSQFFARRGHAGGERFQALEIDRLQALLLAWMQKELERAPFTVVATEQRRPFVFAGLECEARIDRIDRLQDGSLMIIDYKSASASPASWWGERPEQPQLPLYAVIAEKSVPPENVGAIAFAQVSLKQSGFRGAGDEDCAEEELRWDVRQKNDSGHYTWAQQKQEWQRVLSALATDYIEGKADVDPRYHPQQSPRTCQYCGLQPLCRIDHEGLREQGGDSKPAGHSR